ncbi:hypothetical protein R3P38DRAFT_2498468, partial [Favolaschia claudopus]
TFQLRHYLSMVTTQKHREALTSLLLSTHQLALEVLRYANHANQPVQRSQRTCRFCRTEVESPEHALLICVSSVELTRTRDTFFEVLFQRSPQLQTLQRRLSPTDFFKAILYSRPNIGLLAKLAFDVLEIFYAVPLIRP